MPACVRVQNSPVIGRAIEVGAVIQLRSNMGDIVWKTGRRPTARVRPVERYDVGHVQEVIRQAHGELRQLLQQRAEIMKRIGTVKQTISGLANLFGDGVLNEELMELVDRKSSGRQPGFTKACRMILMQAGRAMNARDICDYFQQKMPTLAGPPQGSHGVGHHRAEPPGGIWRGAGGAFEWQTRLALGCRCPRTIPQQTARRIWSRKPACVA